MHPDNSIKSMKLYTHVGRVFNELRELGHEQDDNPLTVDELTPFDQFHYHGTDAIDDAIRTLQLNKQCSVLEIGSGIGGPSRYIAHRTGAHVTALELQQDQSDLGAHLSKRCGLEGLVTHLCGDALRHNWQNQYFDAVVSWLAFYHIPRRAELLDICNGLLQRHGALYIEDLCRLDDPSDAQSEELGTRLFSVTLPLYEHYADGFESAGFQVETMDNMTNSWKEFTRTRLQAYRQNRDRHVRVHGEEIVDALEEFYSTVERFFRIGLIGGVRLHARKL